MQIDLTVMRIFFCKYISARFIYDDDRVVIAQVEIPKISSLFRVVHFFFALLYYRLFMVECNTESRVCDKALGPVTQRSQVAT